MKNEKKREPRDRVLAVKVMATEKREVMEYVKKKCINMSALVRKLLSDEMTKNPL